jgi:hypothetical protein
MPKKETNQMSKDLKTTDSAAGADSLDRTVRQYFITAYTCSKHDPRSYVFIDRGDVRLAICGYDMLPHKVNPDGSYARIQWEEFRKLMTLPNDQGQTRSEAELSAPPCSQFSQPQQKDSK